MKKFILINLVAVATMFSAMAAQPVIRTPVNPPPAPMESNAPPLVEIDIGNQSSKEETHINSGSSTTSKMTSTMDDITKEPLWVKLIGAAIGLGALAWVFFWIIRSVKAGAAGQAAAAMASLADTGAAKALAAAEARLKANTDPAQAANLHAAVADLEKLRGTIASNAPAPSTAPAPHP